MKCRRKMAPGFLVEWCWLTHHFVRVELAFLVYLDVFPGVRHRSRISRIPANASLYVSCMGFAVMRESLNGHTRSHTQLRSYRLHRNGSRFTQPANYPTTDLMWSITLRKLRKLVRRWINFTCPYTPKRKGTPATANDKKRRAGEAWGRCEPCVNIEMQKQCRSNDKSEIPLCIDRHCTFIIATAVRRISGKFLAKNFLSSTTISLTT